MNNYVNESVYLLPGYSSDMNMMGINLSQIFAIVGLVCILLIKLILWIIKMVSKK